MLVCMHVVLIIIITLLHPLPIISGTSLSLSAYGSSALTPCLVFCRRSVIHQCSLCGHLSSLILMSTYEAIQERKSTSFPSPRSKDQTCVPTKVVKPVYTNNIFVICFPYLITCPHGSFANSRKLYQPHCLLGSFK